MGMKSFPERLLQGYRTFMDGRYSTEKGRYRQLADSGQEPHTLVIACCDSRAAPETIFDCGPGELFVVRNVANLVPPYEPDNRYHATSAAVEFAIHSLMIGNILVMGHGRCGGIKAALSADCEPGGPGDFIGQWVSLLKPSADTIRDSSLLTNSEQQTALERISIRNSIGNLRSFPYVAAREEEGALEIHGAWFDISTGELWIMDPESGDFMRPGID